MARTTGGDREKDVRPVAKTKSKPTPSKKKSAKEAAAAAKPQPKAAPAKDERAKTIDRMAMKMADALIGLAHKADQPGQPYDGGVQQENYESSIPGYGGHMRGATMQSGPVSAEVYRSQLPGEGNTPKPQFQAGYSPQGVYANYSAPTTTMRASVDTPQWLQNLLRRYG